MPTRDLSFDGDLLEDALRLAAGGALDADGTARGGPLDFNGHPVLPPVPGMDEAVLTWGAIDYQGASSRLDFDEFGDVTPNFGESVITGGKLVRQAIVKI